MSSRGCPFACAFCANLQQKTRFRSAENIVEEVKLMIDKYGVKHFRVLDDNIIIDKKRFEKFTTIKHTPEIQISLY